MNKENETNTQLDIDALKNTINSTL